MENNEIWILLFLSRVPRQVAKKQLTHKLIVATAGGCAYIGKKQLTLDLIVFNSTFHGLPVFFGGRRLVDVLVHFLMHGIFKSPWKRHLVDVVSLFATCIWQEKSEHIKAGSQTAVTRLSQWQSNHTQSVFLGFLASKWKNHNRMTTCHDGFVLAPLMGVANLNGNPSEYSLQNPFWFFCSFKYNPIRLNFSNSGLPY